MCYDISFAVNIKELADYFPDLVFDSQINIEFGVIAHIQGVSVFPKYPIVYINKEDNKPHCKIMEWGVIEFYVKEEPLMKKRNGMLNIRSERILDDPKSYWYKIRNRRCLIPVSGFYEHRQIVGWKKMVPYHIRPKNQRIFFLPGLYSMAEIGDRQTGEIVQRWTFGLITRAANALMKDIHNHGENKWRMPLVLPFEVAKEFIQPDLAVERYKEILAYEMPGDDLEYYPVDTIRTPKSRADGKEKFEYFDWGGKVPALGELNPEE